MFIIDDVVKGVFDMINGDKAKSNQKELASQQNKLNKDFAEWNLNNVTMPMFEAENAEYQRRWEQDNEYNSPSAQAERMKEAGFYPTGEGFQAGGESVSGPSPSGAQPADLASIMQAVQMGRQTDLQALMLRSQIAKTNAETQNLKKDSETKDTFNKYASEIYAGQVRKTQGEIELLGSNKKLNRAQIRQINQNINLMDSQIMANMQGVQESCERIEQMRIQGRLTEKQIALTSQQITSEMVRQGLDRAKIKQVDAEIKKLLADADAVGIANGLARIYSQYFIDSEGNTTSAGREYMKKRVDGELGQFNLQFVSGQDAQWQYNLSVPYYQMEQNALDGDSFIGKFFVGTKFLGRAGMQPRFSLFGR